MENMPEEFDNIIKLIDEETNEEFEMAVIDAFDYKDKKYAVLITTDDEEEADMIIVEEIENEDGSLSIETLDESVADEIYDYYDELCDEYIDDEDESEEE